MVAIRLLVSVEVSSVDSPANVQYTLTTSQQSDSFIIYSFIFKHLPSVVEGTAWTIHYTLLKYHVHTNIISGSVVL